MTTTPPTDFRAVTFNVQAQRFSNTWTKRRDKVAARLSHVLLDPSQNAPGKASVALLTECYATEASYLADRLNMTPVRHLGSTILFADSWRLGRVWWHTWHEGSHGAVIAELSRDGVTINAAATHTPPPVVFSQPARINCFSRLVTILGGWKDPTLIGGDLNQTGLASNARLAGYASTQQSATELRTHGGTLRKGKAIDYLFTRRMGHRWAGVLTGWGSDHHMISAGLRAPGGDL